MASELTTPNKNKTPDPVGLTPNTRQRKSRLSQALTSYIQEELRFTKKEDQIDVILLSLEHLNLYDASNFKENLLQLVIN